MADRVDLDRLLIAAGEAPPEMRIRFRDDIAAFTAASCGHVFRGRFERVSRELERPTRDGRELMAIVFKLRPAT